MWSAPAGPGWDPAIKKAAAGGVTSQNGGWTPDAEDAGRLLWIDPPAGGSDVSARQCGQTFGRLRGAAELGEIGSDILIRQAFVLHVVLTAAPGSECITPACCLVLRATRDHEGPHFVGALLAAANRYQTEISSRPNRHLAYSHGKFCRGFPTTYDKGQV